MRKADNLPTSCPVVTKSGNLNLLELSGTVQACNGTDLPLPSLLPHLNNFGIIIHTRKINSKGAVKMKSLFTSKLELKFREETSKMLHSERTFVWC